MTKEYPYFKCYQADFEELMIDAVRYALPRPSYVTGNISELLRKYMDRIGKEALMQIRIDILNQKLIYGIPGDWDVLFGLPIDEKITKCFRERFGLWDAECVGYCSWCKSVTNTDKDNDGKTYCSRCGRLKTL